MRDLSDIYALARARKAGRGALFNQMALVRDAYSGDIAVPLPELSDRETPAVANLLVQGLDQMSERVTSTLPDVFYPSVRPGFDAHDKRADDRRSATLGWWTENRMGLKMRLRARHLLGYSATYVKIEPDADNPIPKWVVRNPLSTLPPDVGTDEILLPDCIFSYTKSAAEVAKTFGLPMSILSKGEQGPAKTWEVLEYCDDVETTLALVGPALTGEEALVFSGLGKQVINLEPPIPQRLPNGAVRNIGGTSITALVRTPNLAGVCTVVNAQRITLGRGMGHFDGMIGQYILQARLMSLEAIAVEQAIWPNEWLVSRPSETGEIVRNADGRKGIIGIVNGGQVIPETFTPGTQTYPTMDRLERAQRLTAGIPSEFGGECVDEATEILTAEGWKHYAEVEVGTEVLTLNHDTGLAEWQPVERMNVFPAERREMLLVEGQRFSSLSTLNHRWPVVSRWNGSRKWKDSTTLTANDRIPTAAYCSLPTEAKWTDALVEAVAWFYTEGSFVTHKGQPTSGQISQSLTVNPENVERIRACLTSLFGPATTGWRKASGCGQGGVGHDGVPRWREERIAANGVIKFALSSHAVRVLTEHAPDKVPSFAWLRTLTQAQLDLFIAVSMLADNCGTNRFGQKDARRTEALGFAVVLSGRNVSYSSRTREDARPEWPTHTAHMVGIKKRRHVIPMENARVVPGAVAERVTHDGIVWCPTTPNGTWFARRKGTCYFTGNSVTNVRTGARGSQIMSATIDFPIQEYQDILAASLEAENKVAIAVTKAYWGSKRMTFDVRWPWATKGKSVMHADYTPDTTFDSDSNQVTFTHSGADINALVTGIGQRVGLGTLSVETAQRLDPMIDDPATERRLVTVDKLEAALMAGLQQQVQAGSINPADLAALIVKYKEGDENDLAKAALWLQEQAQKRQATSGPPGTETGPAEPGSPEAQPGLAAGTPAAAGAGVPQVQGPNANISNLADLVRRLHGAQAATAGGPSTSAGPPSPPVAQQLAAQGA